MLAQHLLWKNIDELWAFIMDILGDGTKRVLISAVVPDGQQLDGHHYLCPDTP